MEPLVEQTPLYNDFQISEHEICKEWGVKVADLAVVRRGYLRQDAHWQWRDTRVWYSPSGKEELRRYVVPKAPQDLAAAKETLVQAQVRRHLPNTYPLSGRIVAVDRIWANPFLIRCVDCNGALYSVRVRSNRHFRKGMRINLDSQAREAPGGGDNGSLGLWVLLDRPPRLPGRW